MTTTSCAPARCPIRSMRWRSRSQAGPLPSDAVVPLRASGRNEPFAFVLTTPASRTLVPLDPLNRVSIAGPSALAP